MKQKENNYFMRFYRQPKFKLGWKLDYRKFRVYLAVEKYVCQKAYIFIGL